MMYRALVGIDYTTKLAEEARVEAGETFDDLLDQTAKWLLAHGLIEEVQTPKKTPRKKATKKDTE